MKTTKLYSSVSVYIHIYIYEMAYRYNFNYLLFQVEIKKIVWKNNNYNINKKNNKCVLAFSPVLIRMASYYFWQTFALYIYSNINKVTT